MTDIEPTGQFNATQTVRDRFGSSDRILVFAGRHADTAMWALIGLNLIPIWLFSYFPALDGPAHVSLTWWLVHYGDPQLPLLRAFFEPNFPIIPNYLIFLILYPLMHVFSAVVAEKLLISFYAILLPLALRYALGGAAAEGRGFAIIGCAITFHALLLLGFYNTSFAIPVFLVAFGYWLRARHRIDLRALGTYAALGVLAYITHLSAVAATCLAIFFATVGLAIGDLRVVGLAAAWRRTVSHGIWPAIGFGPALIFCLAYLMRGDGEKAAAGVAGLGLPDLDRLLGILRLEAFIGHDARELLVAIGLMLTLYVAVRSALRTRPYIVNSGLYVFGGFLAIYLIIPYQFDVRWMPTRLMPYVFLGAILWLAGIVARVAESRQLAVVGVVVLCTCALTLTGTGFRLTRWADIDALLTEYMSANALIEPNTTMLALRLSREIDGRLPSDRIEIMLQAPGYIAAERGVVDLRHFQAQTGAFPLVFRESVNPYRHLATDAQFVGAPTTIIPMDYQRATGQPIDYVLLWGEDGSLLPESPLARDLAAHYDLIHVSEPRGAMRLFRLVD